MNIANIALAFPSTLHRRSQYLSDKVSVTSVSQYVVSSMSFAMYL